MQLLLFALTVTLLFGVFSLPGFLFTVSLFLIPILCQMDEVFLFFLPVVLKFAFYFHFCSYPQIFVLHTSVNKYKINHYFYLCPEQYKDVGAHHFGFYSSIYHVTAF